VKQENNVIERAMEAVEEFWVAPGKIVGKIN
jgi:hypothetical protein